MICCALFMTLIAFTSCKDAKPEYKFKLENAGEVVDTPTNIQNNVIAELAPAGDESESENLNNSEFITGMEFNQNRGKDWTIDGVDKVLTNKEQ